MDSTTTEKYQLVSEWLKSTFAQSKQVPEFEINKETIDCLFQLATLNRRRNEECEIITEDVRIKAKEYRLESARVASILSGVGIDLGESSPVRASPTLRAAVSEYVDLDLLNQICETANLISALSNALSLGNTSCPALVAAVSDLSLLQRKVKENRRLEQEKIDHLKGIIQEATETLHSLNRSKKILEEKFEAQKSTIADRQSQLKYLDGKSKEYAVNIQVLKEAIRTSGATPAIYHSALRQLNEQLTALEKTHNTSQNQLTAFKQLPPDTTLAKLKIEETKRELRIMEEELSRSVNSLQLNRLE